MDLNLVQAAIEKIPEMEDNLFLSGNLTPASDLNSLWMPVLKFIIEFYHKEHGEHKESQRF